MPMPSFNIFILNSPEQKEPKKNKLKEALDRERNNIFNMQVLNELKKISASTPITSHTGGG